MQEKKIQPGNVYTLKGRDNKWRVAKILETNSNNIIATQYGKSFSSQPTWENITSNNQLEVEELNKENLQLQGINYTFGQTEEWIYLGYVKIEEDETDWLNILTEIKNM